MQPRRPPLGNPSLLKHSIVSVLRFVQILSISANDEPNLTAIIITRKSIISLTIAPEACTPPSADACTTFSVPQFSVQFPRLLLLHHQCTRASLSHAKTCLSNRVPVCCRAYLGRPPLACTSVSNKDMALGCPKASYRLSLLDATSLHEIWPSKSGSEEKRKHSKSSVGQFRKVLLALLCISNPPPPHFYSKLGLPRTGAVC